MKKKTKGENGNRSNVKKKKLFGWNKKSNELKQKSFTLGGGITT